jgi:phenylacetate-CoA ligase
MHGLALIYAIRDLPGIKQFKIMQESLDVVRVLLVVTNGFEASSPDRIRDAFKARLGAAVQVPIEIVDEIKPERSGKFRYVISAVTPGSNRASEARTAQPLSG